MQRRYAAGSEDFGMSQGCSFPARLPVGSSGLPLIRCPRCGAAVVECRSMRHGGKVFFKCEENEQDVSIPFVAFGVFWSLLLMCICY